jgi:hypothetical protein
MPLMARCRPARRRKLLADLAVIGATVEPAGDRLILRAGSTAIPATLVNRIREAKANLIAMLTLRKGRGLVREEQEPVGKSAVSNSSTGRSKLASSSG